MRDQMVKLDREFKASPPKTPADVVQRLGRWSECGDASIKAWNKESRFVWNMDGKPLSRSAVWVEIKKSDGACNPNAPISRLEVLGQNETDDGIDRMYP